MKRMATECSSENMQTPRLIHVAVPTDQLTVDSCNNDLDEDLKEQSHIPGMTNMVIQLQSLHEDDLGEQPAKRIRIDNDFTPEINSDLSVKQILFNINKAICLRLDGIEHKLECLSQKMKTLDDKIDVISNHMKQNGTSIISPAAQRKSGAVIVGIPQSDTKQEPAFDSNIQNLGPNVTLITLNTEDDYPSGCWLGDESNPEMRVRVPVTPSDLLHVHSNCRTAEKMALTLLDYLFDRETQASSNLSGQGKHGKKQLDPLMIYGIRCHLIHRFNVAENDWHRIKQNIDSKCRTAFRRRQKGMPLTVKAFRGKGGSTYDGLPPDSVQMPNVHIGSSTSDEDSMNHEDSDLQIQTGDVDISQAVAVHPADMGGEIQILHATPEQISQLQQAQHIQILQGDHVIQQVQQIDGSVEGVQVSVPLPVPLPVSTVSTDTGEIIQIQRCDGETS